MNQVDDQWRKKQRHVLCMLSEMKGVGCATIRRLMDQLKDLSQIPKLRKEDAASLAISPNKLAQIQEQWDEKVWIQKLKMYQRNGIEIVTYYDQEYPDSLKQIANPPWVLYCKGDIRLLKSASLAFVGTRYPTSYGKQAAMKLARQCSEQGWTIVSGMALGIDTASHQGALLGKGKTIAVMGTGMDRWYPPQNRELYEKIAKEGLIVTEYPWGMKPHPGLFPQRNRIIAALTMGTIVIEAAEKSGSLITADCALEYSKDVFAVPGSIFSRQSQGTLKLIQQGAKLVIEVNDILEEYRHVFVSQELQASPIYADQEQTFSDEEQRIIDLLAYHSPLSTDDLLEKTNLSFGQLHSVLMSLMLRNKIEQVPGSMYVLNYR